MFVAYNFVSDRSINSNIIWELLLVCSHPSVFLKHAIEIKKKKNAESFPSTLSRAVSGRILGSTIIISEVCAEFRSQGHMETVAGLSVAQSKHFLRS